MEKIRLGRTGLEVSRLCFGTEPFTVKKGPLGRGQGDRTPEEGGRILREALARGVNFWDTSYNYLSHPHIAEGLRMVRRRDVVIADKSNANTSEKGERAVEVALRELGTDYIDVMMLHYVPFQDLVWFDAHKRRHESTNLGKRRGALKAFCEAKESGAARAVGLSTHSTKVLIQVLDVPEIEVVLTVLNKRGSRIEDGTLEEHLEAIRRLHESGRGVYVCKVMDAGNLWQEWESAVNAVLQHREFVHAWNIGMYSLEDVERNVRVFDEVFRG